MRQLEAFLAIVILALDAFLWTVVKLLPLAIGGLALSLLIRWAYAIATG